MRIKGTAYHGRRNNTKKETDILVTDWGHELCIECQPDNGRITTIILDAETTKVLRNYLNENFSK